jgi:hypothetical protein
MRPKSRSPNRKNKLRMLTIRPFSEADDDIGALTGLLHRAYAPLASRGLRFTATHQLPEVTLRRLHRGYPLVAHV